MDADEMMNRILSKSCASHIEMENGEEWQHFTVSVHCVEFNVVARPVQRTFREVEGEWKYDYSEFEIKGMSYRSI